MCNFHISLTIGLYGSIIIIFPSILKFWKNGVWDIFEEMVGSEESLY